MDPILDALPAWFTGGADPKLMRVSIFYGSIVLVGGVAGTWLGGWLADRTGGDRPASYALIPACCFLVAAPAFALGLFAPSLIAGWLLFALGQMLALAWLGPVIAAVQHIVPPNMRATSSASFLFINNLIGIGFGIFFLGFMSDRMTAAHGADALQYSILYGLGFYLLSAGLYFLAAARLRIDWYRG
jgi:MFS family permease